MWAIRRIAPRAIPCLPAKLTTAVWPCSYSNALMFGRFAKSPAVPIAVRAITSRSTKSQIYRDIPEGVAPIPIAIVGRPNVGKSTLFNRLQSVTNKQKTLVPRKAVTSKHAGTTRDRKDTLAVFGGLVLRVIDTGGLEGEDATKNNTLLAGMQQQTFRAVAEAAAILFVIDAREGVTPLDIEIARMVRAGHSASFYRDPFSSKPSNESPPIILVANKAEGAFIGPYLNDCYDLGLGDPVSISATLNEGFDDLYDRLCLEVGHLQEEDEEDEDDNDMELSEDGSTEAVSDGSETEESDDDQPGSEAAFEADEAPLPTLSWLPPKPLTKEQKHSLRWFAMHPDDPLGKLDEGFRASILHKESSEVKNYWLAKPQALLPDKETRDFVMKFRRLEDQERAIRIAVIGLPNSGKSSLINALLQEERCVVDPTVGTTMDSVVSDWKFKDKEIKLIDTCGIMKGWKYPGEYSELLEPGMGAKRAIRRSHVVVLCVDPRHMNDGPISTPNKFEIRLGNFVAEEGKCLVIAVNKWDTVPEDDQQKFRATVLERIKMKFASLKGVPVVFLSAKYNLNLSTLMTRALALEKRWSARLPTSRINDWLQRWMLRWPPPWRFGQKRTVKYMTQTRSRPPTFVLWSNTTSGEFPKNYMRQLQNQMREEFRISGVPMRMLIRTTMMPKSGKKMNKASILKWKRIGPKQERAVTNLTSKKTVRRRQTE